MNNINFKRLVIFTIFILSFSNVWAEIYKEDAVVSFYAEDFHGKRTSNGETFNMYDLTCANKSLPFDTKLKVTNLANGKSVTVRVNDRGPFVLERELDLSKAAAAKLDMINQGTAHVKIEIIEKGPDTKISRDTAAKAMEIANKRAGKSTSTAVATTPKPVDNSTVQKTSVKYDSNKMYDIQLGSFKTRENAEKRAREVKANGFSNIVLQHTGDVIRVVIKVPGNKVLETEKELKACGFNEYLVKERKN